ncbi:LppX_LprAFG lipoprotein [Nocardioides anomalus]|uniref:LppX_LprAFG lipoprotein n=1 Tax=Nocardioides anomalus TaxID=2712223 RepID=A0A6G6WBW4_9ACTN|nr:LppX_LprAFG lipoprotein [Nocardioides anomalus]QIG42696.1 LppX_LprAFG lipoprotein [Nocardioides anomalus]
MKRPARRLAAPLVLALALTVTACSGDDSGSGGSGGGDGGSQASPAEVLAAAKKNLDDTTGVAITLSTKNLPDGVTGISSAEGTGVHPSAFEGSFDLSVNGLPATADVIAVGGTTYAKNSLLLPDWTEIDPADYGAPDPAKLMDPDGGFSGLLAQATDAKAGDQVRGGSDNKEILTEYTGTVPSDAVAALIPDAAGDFDFTYTISNDDQLRQAVLTGAFYGEKAGEVTYTLTLDDYGTEKQITAP